jgi:putative Holliday junction resolvase
VAIPPSGRILAVDWGEVRIGLARSDESQTIAFPLDTLVRRAGRRFPMLPFLAHVEHEHPVGVIVGLPLTPDGNEGAAAAAARGVAELIARRTSLPIEMVDERMTTARSHAAIREQSGSTRGRKEEVDALAASVLLQHFLETRRHASAQSEGAS